MKRTLYLAVFAIIFFAAACGSDKNSGRNRLNPAGPSETIPDQVKPVQTVSIAITKVSGNTYQVIVSGPDLPNTFPTIPTGSWSGALMWLHESTRNYNYVTDVPFEPGKTDHFTFPYVNNAGTVEFSLRLQPKGTLTRIPIILNEKVRLPAGYKLVWDDKAAEVRVQGPLPS